jgi:O6-methylguanine-DNA--protein-cysteine methyltransferase
MNYPTDAVTSSFDSPLGRIQLAASPRGLLGAWFEGQHGWEMAGSLTGYSGGIDRKVALLQLERTA